MTQCNQPGCSRTIPPQIFHQESYCEILAKNNPKQAMRKGWIFASEPSKEVKCQLHSMPMEEDGRLIVGRQS